MLQINKWTDRHTDRRIYGQMARAEFKLSSGTATCPKFKKLNKNKNHLKNMKYYVKTK